MKVVCLIQARAGSRRFPGQIFADLNGAPVIGRVYDAARAIKGVNAVHVIYPESFPARAEEDVLGRYADAAARHEADVIVRLTGDCPLFDPQVGTAVLERYLDACNLWTRDAWAYVSNVWPVRTWPDGLDCEVFSKALLLEASMHAEAKEDREHVTPWMRRAVYADGHWLNVTLPVDWSHVRLTVDTKEDLEWLKIALKAPRSF